MKSAARRTALPFLIAAGAFVVYWRTLLPGVSPWGDSAKFQYIAQVWGIPHPTGYPLYILVTRLFSLLPWGDVAYRINLLSALCAALAIGTLFVLARLVARDRLAALAAALVLAFSPLFWSQAVAAEVYAFNALFVAVCLVLMLSWRQTGRLALLGAFMLAYGLSFSHHASMLLLLPAFLFWLISREPRALVKPRTWLVGLAGVALGLLPYTYILVRASQGALYSEFPPLAGQHSLRALLSAFVDYASGAQFRGGYFGVFAQGPAAVWQRVQLLGLLIVQQFGWWGIGFGLLGLAALWRRDRTLAAGLVVAILGEAIFVLGYRIIDPEVFFIPACLVWAVCIAGGLAWIGEWLRRMLSTLTGLPETGPSRRFEVHHRGTMTQSEDENGPWCSGVSVVMRRSLSNNILPRAVLGVVCVALVAVPLITNWPQADRSSDTRARRWAEGFLKDLEPQALLVLPQPYFYSQKQVLLYMMLAEGIRPDLGFISTQEVDRWVGRLPVYLAVWMPEVAERYRVRAVDSARLRLADYLAGLPDGTIVVAAARDEASRQLSAEAVAAWRLLGGQADLRGCFRCAHALVGVKGAVPGTALEASGGGLKSFALRAGDPIGATGVAAPVSITVRSAGLDDGDVGDIWLGPWQVSPQHRGYNVVALDPRTGRLLGAVYADTFDSDLVDNVRKYQVSAR